MKAGKLIFLLLVLCIGSLKAAAQTDSTSSEVTMKLFPNPVTTSFTIQGLNPSEKSQVTVSSSDGKVVFQNKVSGYYTCTMNASKLKPGLYYVTIKEGKSTVALRFLKE